jgi:ubiquinone/menaquinone biosynthesis C-methylase UbiE
MTALAPKRMAGALALGGAAVAAGFWYRRYTTPFPYTHRWMLDKELPYLTRDRLQQILEPRREERMLEIGPGTGLFSLPVATSIGPGGTLSVIDVQQEMLDHTVAAARGAGVENIVAARQDARELPYDSDSFDGAFMVTVLGEIPEFVRALGELHRVLRPGGRLVVGEFLIDWHAVPLGVLRRRAGSQGFAFERRLGPRFSYLARFTKPRAAGFDSGR